MKIGILTQPLYFNYGGVLQAYALYNALQKMGHEVWIINRVDSYSHGYIYRSLSKCKNVLKNYFSLLFGKIKYTDFKRKSINLSSYQTFVFVSERMPNRSKELHSDKELLSFVKKMNFDAYVVGSDQVWRPKYSPNIYTYFLDFSSEQSRKVAYAASFGVDTWEYTNEETLVCSDLLQRFNAVSVREISGIFLCTKYLNRSDAKFVLDPTLLFDSEFYLALIKSKGLEVSKKNYLLSYILDINEEKENLTNRISSVLKIPMYVAQQGKTQTCESYDFGLASIEEWLYGFANAEFAVVDSFHGCVFSLIFHVPFIVIANDSRGITRFKSLLSLFNLESRLLESVDLFTSSMLTYAFPWEKIDSKKEELRKQSLNFLLNSLS